MTIKHALDRSPKLAEMKVSYRRRRPLETNQNGELWKLSNAQAAVDYLRAIWNHATLELIEDFFVVCLNTANEPLGWLRVSSGGLDSTCVDPRLIFSVALQTASTGIVVAHNHPSGNILPSEHDRRITRRLKEAGDLLAIRLVDHIILSKDSSFSFADQRLL